MSGFSSNSKLLRGAALAALLATAACESSGTRYHLASAGSPTSDDGSSSGSGTGSTADSGGSGDGSVTTGSVDGSGSGSGTDGSGSNGSGSSGGTGTGSTGGSQTGQSLRGTLGRVSDVSGDLGGGVLATTGNVVMGVGSTAAGLTPGQTANGLTRLVSRTGQVVANTGTALQNGGLGGTPVVGSAVNGVIARGDGVLNGVAGATVANRTVLGSAGTTPAIGASVLSSSTPAGSVATAGVLSGGSGATVSALPNAAGTPAVAVSALSPTAAPAASIASVGALSGGSGVTASVLPGATNGGGLVNANAGNATVGSQPALVGAGVLAPTTPTGRAASVGVLSGGKLLSVNTPGR